MVRSRCEPAAAAVRSDTGEFIQRLSRPIFADGSGNPLDQFFAIGLQSLGLALRLLLFDRIHENPFL
jgi:hypothetical protein